MEIIGAKVVLTIDEPWDSYRVIEAKITQSVSREGDSYLLVTGFQSSENFIVTTRYKGDNLNDIILGKMIIVDIAVLSDNEISSFSRMRFSTNVRYIGIGSIELFKGGEKQVYN